MVVLDITKAFDNCTMSEFMELEKSKDVSNIPSLLCNDLMFSLSLASTHAFLK